MKIIFKSTEILISVLTLILTPIFSALIVYYQLRKSQFYWKKQQKFMNKMEFDRLRISTYRETVELINELNDAILNHHIYASNRDMTMALANILKDISPIDAKYFSEQFVVQKLNAENSYLKMRQLSVRFSGLGVNIKVYFDQDIFNLFLELQNKLKAAQNPVMSKENVAIDLNSLVVEQGDWIRAKQIFTEQYDAKSEKQRPISETNAFLTEMMRQFDKIKK
jgi:hypothetical protein